MSVKQPEDQNKWHLKREVQLGHIITTITVVVSVVIYTQKQEQRIALLENHVAVQRERDERQDKSQSEAITQVRSHLERMEAKLDRLIEYKVQRK